MICGKGLEIDLLLILLGKHLEEERKLRGKQFTTGWLFSCRSGNHPNASDSGVTASSSRSIFEVAQSFSESHFEFWVLVAPSALSIRRISFPYLVTVRKNARLFY